MLTYSQSPATFPFLVPFGWSEAVSKKKKKTLSEQELLGQVCRSGIARMPGGERAGDVNEALRVVRAVPEIIVVRVMSSTELGS